MRLNVNPTRMELSKLKTKHSFAKRGHKLLKNKEDELIRRFLDFIDRDKVLREEMEEKLSLALKIFVKAAVIIPPADLKEALFFTERKSEIEVIPSRILNLETSKFSLKTEGDLHRYRFSAVNSQYDKAVILLNEVLPLMIQVAGLEDSIILLAQEIERTRRRVNALEYRLIPDLDDTIKYISMKLSEIERGNLSRLMRLKEFSGTI